VSVFESCIKSVKEQTHLDVEYIVIDGSSTDGTLSLLHQNKKKLSVLISEPDKGIYDALNKGISCATGDVIGLLHSDDVFADNKVLSLISRIFEINPKIHVVIGNAVLLDPCKPNIIKRMVRSDRFRPWMLRFGFMPAHTATFIRSSVFKKIGVYRNDYQSASDFEFFVRLFWIYRVRCHYINQTLVHMRIGGTSTSGIKSYLKSSHEILHILKRHKFYSNKLFVLSRLPIKWISNWIFYLWNSKILRKF
jgi:glycosyltransferase involved in cell wall biosynthesis